MGSIIKGVHGGFSGKVGNVIGSSWKGVDYLRSLPRKSSKPATEDQVGQQLKFALAVNFMKPISSLVNVGFKNKSKQKVSGYNVAVQFVLKNCITGIFPDYAIDYSKLLISEGSLAPSMDAAAVSTVPGTLAFTWKDNTVFEDKAHADDKAILLVYSETKSRYIFTTAGAERSEKGQALPIPENFSGDTVQVYIAFISRDGKSVATSTYIGAVVVV